MHNGQIESKRRKSVVLIYPKAYKGTPSGEICL